MREGQEALALTAWSWLLEEEARLPAISQVLRFTHHTSSDSAYPRTVTQPRRAMHHHLRLRLVPEKPHPDDLADREIWGILLSGCGDAGWDHLPMTASRPCRPSPTPCLQVRRAFNEPSGCWRAPSRLWLGPGPVTPGESFLSGWSGEVLSHGNSASPHHLPQVLARHSGPSSM